MTRSFGASRAALDYAFPVDRMVQALKYAPDVVAAAFTQLLSEL